MVKILHKSNTILLPIHFRVLIEASILDNKSECDWLYIVVCPTLTIERHIYMKAIHEKRRFVSSCNNLFDFGISVECSHPSFHVNMSIHRTLISANQFTFYAKF